MAWSKLKQNLESFLAPALQGRVEYLATSYRYLPDKPGRCYIAVDKKHVFNMSGASSPVRWYRSEQEIKSDDAIRLPIGEAEIEAVRQTMKGPIPDDRLAVIARGRKLAELAKALMEAQAALSKSDFDAAATRFLAASIEESLASGDILTNILALIDRRVGKKRLLNLSETMKLKHPIVRYFYELRLHA